MVKVKKTIAKVKKEAAKSSPAASPKSSPADSPAAKPAASPKSKPAAAEAPVVNDVEKARLTREAVEEILKGIAQPEAQKTGAAFIPDKWHVKYKPALGGYKRFVQSQSDKLAIAEGPGGTFIVVKAGDKRATQPGSGGGAAGGNWKKQLESAWATYCQATPQAERSVEAFTAALPKAARIGKAAENGPAQKAAAAPQEASKPSPQTSPKPSPKASPKGPAPTLGKKKKLKGGEAGKAKKAK